MNENPPDKFIIREYLLGRLNAQPELEERVSKQLYFDDDFHQMAESIEDDIIDEYLDTSLNLRDMQAVEQYFLCAPERKDKLQFARVLRRHFETTPTTSVPAKLALHRIGAGQIVSLRSRLRTYVEVGTLLLLSISCLLYVRALHSSIADSKSALMQIEGKLEEQRQRSARLEKQMAELLPPVAELTLANERTRSLSRGVGVRELEIRPSTRVIKIEIVLSQDAPPGPFDVALESRPEKTTLWSKAMVRASAGVLAFDMMPQGVVSGDYSIAVRPHAQPSGSVEHYDFQVTVTK